MLSDEARAVLVLARALPLGRTGGMSALDGNGAPCHYDSGGACKFCVLGRIWTARRTLKCGYWPGRDAENALMEIDWDIVGAWERGERTEADVNAVFDKALAPPVPVALGPVPPCGEVR
jgi:hypothetical protein